MEAPVEAEVKPESRDAASEQFGSETGSDFGVPEGMEGGVEGGVVGGVPGGVLGGVLGGTGTGPVLDYDKPPRLLRQTKPVYPQEAFVKKIEGIVLVEILIDSTGRVARARILQSIPSLDKAALQTVYQWIFSPAIKHGRPVPTIAHVPVGFRIYEVGFRKPGTRALRSVSNRRNCAPFRGGSWAPLAFLTPSVTAC